ncbi:MAG: EAL domain-containing protein [Nitrosomonas sp.]|nr:EAL domain-containing protein [Nitrosomonas sp.]
MKLEKKVLRSKVARRMLMFFVLSTCIPVFFLALLSYSESNEMLLKKARHQLDAASDNYNKAIYDRLLLVDQLLNDTVSRLASKNDLQQLDSQIGQRIRHLTLFLFNQESVPVYGQVLEIGDLSSAELRHLSLKRSLLKTQVQETETKILIVRALDANVPEKGLLIAEIMPEYLWGDPSTFSLDLEHCILNENHVTLFCSHQPQDDAMQQSLQQHTRQIKGELSWQSNDIAYIANYHEIFLQPQFLTPRWLVVAMQPETEALGNLSNFNTIFWGSAILSVLLIMLFSMIQIRRVLVPLEKLIDGTRRLGKHDFSTQVDVISADEFGELAISFNEMTAKLGNQFETLIALSRIDQEILSGLDINKITQNALIHLHKMIEAEFISIVVFDHDVPEKASIHILDITGQRLLVQDYEVSQRIQALLGKTPTGIWIDDPLTLQWVQVEQTELSPPHLARLFLLPLNWKDQMVGYISLGFGYSITWSSENTQRIQDYADRIAVALFTKNREELLLRQARIDALTELPNRFLFMEQLHKEIAQNQRNERKLAVLYIDLDRFKLVNDSYGHSMGDELLREAGQRLQACVYAGDTVARLGGDEFAVIISELESENDAKLVAEKIIGALAKPFIIHSDKNIIAASIGIAIYPHDGTNISDLMRNSDIAMYRAKEKGGNQCIFFEESMNAEISKRASLERGLREAITEQQFVLHYQPQVDPKSGMVRGVETLVRWNHPELGFISPGTFIPIAEDTGLIIDIGRIVLHEACAQYRQWADQGIDLEYVAVNVSVKQFRQPDFFQMVENVLKINNLHPHCLELEITESVLMDDMDVVMVMLEKLKNLGIQLSIDDFGTGYSSMSYLEQLPFDTIKIDISFVRKIQSNGEGGTIAATIAAMAHTLNKRIVAEGVEVQSQLDFLIKCDCELIQGYFFSRPLPADELAVYVKSNHAAAHCAIPIDSYLLKQSSAG